MGIDGNKLRELRLKEGIGQVELADRVGVSQSAISQFEVGCRSAQADTIEAIARELHCSYEDIAGEPPLWTMLLRNCKGLSQSQLKALNTMAVELAKCSSPAVEAESAGTPTNMPSAEICALLNQLDYIMSTPQREGVRSECLRQIVRDWRILSHVG